MVNITSLTVLNISLLDFLENQHCYFTVVAMLLIFASFKLTLVFLKVQVREEVFRQQLIVLITYLISWVDIFCISQNLSKSVKCITRQSPKGDKILLLYCWLFCVGFGDKFMNFSPKEVHSIALSFCMCMYYNILYINYRNLLFLIYPTKKL